MSMYRFTGTLKEIVSSPTNKTLKFIPDQECSVMMKSGKDETKFVVFLPVDEKGSLSDSTMGIVFAYDELVCICLGSSKQEWLPAWKAKGHYKIVVEESKSPSKTRKTTTAPSSEKSGGSEDVTITIEEAGSPKQFHLVSVAEIE